MKKSLLLKGTLQIIIYESKKIYINHFWTNQTIVLKI